MRTYKVEAYITRINYSGMTMTNLYVVEAKSEDDARMMVRKMAKIRGYISIIKNIEIA